MAKTVAGLIPSTLNGSSATSVVSRPVNFNNLLYSFNKHWLRIFVVDLLTYLLT